MSEPTDQQLREQWGAEVRRRREDLGWTQTRLAEEAGIPQTKISLIERAVSGGSNRTRIALARAFGVEVHELFAFPSTTTGAAS